MLLAGCAQPLTEDEYWSWGMDAFEEWDAQMVRVGMASLSLGDGTNEERHLGNMRDAQRIIGDLGEGVVPPDVWAEAHGWFLLARDQSVEGIGLYLRCIETDDLRLCEQGDALLDESEDNVVEWALEVGVYLE